MKNYIKFLAVAFAACMTFWSCQDEHEFGALKNPTNLEISYSIVGADAENPDGDGSGLVDFTATADDAISYKYVFSDMTSINAPTGQARKRFSQNGTHTYSVTVIASGTGGISTTKTIEVTVFALFNDDEAVTFLTGAGTKTWYWAAAEAGHLGVGPNDNNTATNYLPTYYSAAPFEKAGSPDSSCLYDNELTFTLDNGVLKYELDNGGKTFFNAAFLGVGGGSGGSDLCLDYNVSGEKIVTLGPSESLVDPSHTRGTTMTFSDGGFMGYYIGQNQYEILEITENRMVVRAVMGNDPGLAWYHIFSTSPPVQSGPGFDTLVWSDEFDVPGAPDATKWGYNIGTGTNGWGNNEHQYYTDSSDNVIVADGMLKITARAQSFNGSDYTSARLVTENKFEFTYGKVEVRAKLPSGGGTWPAIWLLGENYATNTWPACGEIDIMEHVGNQQNTISAALHYPGSSGGSANTGSTVVSNVSTQFHVYSVEWSQTSIKFFVDGQEFHSFANPGGSPFHSDFFLILNIAMGGNLGGAIDPAFTQSTMEIDYVRVYQ